MLRARGGIPRSYAVTRDPAGCSAKPDVHAGTVARLIFARIQSETNVARMSALASQATRGAAHLGGLRAIAGISLDGPIRSPRTKQEKDGNAAVFSFRHARPHRPSRVTTLEKPWRFSFSSAVSVVIRIDLSGENADQGDVSTLGPLRP